MTKQKKSINTDKFKTKETTLDKGKIEWEGETVQAESKTNLEQDTGSGIPVVLRFFDFGANVESFKNYKPTAQDLFNSHLKGIESLLWRDELKPFLEVEPRLMYSVDGKNFEPYSPKGKQYTHYRFIVACVPNKSLVSAFENTQTLSQLLTPQRAT